MSAPIVVAVSIVTEDEAHAAQAAETLGRALTGLALSGISGALNVARVPRRGRDVITTGYAPELGPATSVGRRRPPDLLAIMADVERRLAVTARLIPPATAMPRTPAYPTREPRP